MKVEGGLMEPADRPPALHKGGKLTARSRGEVAAVTAESGP